jgi:predicted nuclease of predicted toxin-antitoxin system
MKFKIDENLPIEVADIVIRAGHDALTVFDEALIGEIDGAIALVCQQEQRVLLTLDLDFADIHTYPPHHYPGIIVVRSKHQDKWSVMAMVERVVKALEREPITQALWIVDEQRIRIRE